MDGWELLIFVVRTYDKKTTIGDGESYIPFTLGPRFLRALHPSPVTPDLYRLLPLLFSFPVIEK